MAKIWSHPNENGEHTLKCPNCKTVFLSPIRKDGETDKVLDVTCPHCSHKDQPLAFVGEQHKEEAFGELKKLFK